MRARLRVDPRLPQRTPHNRNPSVPPEDRLSTLRVRLSTPRVSLRASPLRSRSVPFECPKHREILNESAHSTLCPLSTPLSSSSLIPKNLVEHPVPLWYPLVPRGNPARSPRRYRVGTASLVPRLWYPARALPSTQLIASQLSLEYRKDRAILNRARVKDPL